MATSPKPHPRPRSRPRTRLQSPLIILSLTFTITFLSLFLLLRTPFGARVMTLLSDMGHGVEEMAADGTGKDEMGMGKGKGKENHVVFSNVEGYFIQDEEGGRGGEGFDYTKTNLGLINRSYDTDALYDPLGERTQWQRFEFWIGWLNGEGTVSASEGRVEDVADDGNRNEGEGEDTKDESGKTQQRYKVLYLGRHGEGYHNMAEAYYGTAAWDCYWSLQTGNGTLSWDDALLTPTGITQALVAHTFWSTHVQVQKIPAPQSYYVSPLSRCLETAKLTFEGLVLPHQQPFVPVVKELFRESIGVHTCDRRRSRTYIRENYPGYVVEEGFVELDPFWKPDLQETESAEEERLRIVLDDVFRNDERTFISVTTHSGTIAAILRVLRHRKFSLSTGAVIPVLVKIVTVDGPAPTRSAAPYTTVSTCVTPPPTPTQ